MKKYEMKKSDLDALEQKVQFKKGLNQFKVGTIAAAITSLVCVSIPAFAADLEIYVPGNSSQGATTIMFLLDISGSMDTRSIEQDYGNICTKDRRGNATFEGNTTDGEYCVASGNEITNQIIKDCNKSGSEYKCYDRISRLRQGMLAVLEGDTAKGVKKLDDDLVIGLSTLGAYTTTYHEAGAVKVPARALNETVSGTSKTQREILIEEVKKLRGQTNTPTTRSYAEVVAYLMGKTTQITGGEWYFEGVYDRRNIYSECLSMSGTGTCLTWGQVYYGSVPSGFTRGASKTVGGYPGNVYTANNAYSGFGYSSDLTKNTGKTAYAAPTTISRQISYTDDQKKCSGQGVYVLTDGVPNYGNGASGLIRKALGNKGAGFECTDSGAGWNCTLNLASALLDSTKNPANISFKTAVVGFGSDFNTIPSSIQTEAGVDALTGISDDIKQAAKWGIRGRGGWYSGSNAKDVAESIADFVDKAGGEIPSISTGSSTVPMDALNPEIIQKYAYFPQFEPKVKSSDSTQLWFGNLKKYFVVKGGVYADKDGSASQTVVLKSKLQDLPDQWAKSGVAYPENAPVFSKGGALSKLALGTTTTIDGSNSTTTAGRKLLTNYDYDDSKAESERVGQNFDLNRIDYTYTTDNKTKTDNAARVRGLMTLLGYNISTETETNNLNLTDVPTSIRQMGSVYHSLPVLLTQEGKAVATRNAATQQVEISSVGRKDYVMFGTTQGLLSVVDAVTGVEKFSFVPKEMIEKQAETFRENAGSLVGGKDALYYGIDGEWAAHTVYVTKSDGTLTVNGTVRDVIGGSKDDVENLNGKQWVYGGLRMGGRSYYSLDLTDIASPKLKFHIDPTTGKVYSKANASGKAYKAIENMAQSWSKPKLDYVNWKGQRKLVMFVGGGYDAGGENGDGLFVNGIRTGYEGYEKYNYKQGDGKKGSGVYMFDADNGDLLWYADSSDKAADNGVQHATNTNLKYSVASDIKTIDRNNDGIVDHIYFGDLAGQAFRVDFQNDGNDTNFSSQVTQILNLHQTDGTSPRFYMSPVFTAHHSAGKKEGANIIVVSFVSGNKSSPLLATDDSPASTGKKDPLGLQYDAVYAVYDYDIHPDGTFYPQTHISARTLAAEDSETASTNQLKYIDNDNVVRSDSTEALVLGANANSSTGWGGWYYPFKKKFSSTLEDREDAGASIIKGLSPLIAMEGSLYVTQYDASNNGTSSSCGAGVKGHSFTQRLCLPTGVCPQNANYVYNLGAGIVNLNVGPYGDSGKKSIVVPDPTDTGVGCIGDDCNTDNKFITAGGSIRFIPNRWFERYAKAD
ncbi:hypothetical protein [Acinetobacter pseudolwoffii]|uniref:hypothetical protein n=1 Tax=Acinetobacter pseudolwoffii TaxID=2053287 RepID=UPI000C23B584|nr:hypothetical protein [Acinetobacter pseudolwoffii]PJI35082.1 hypothetical protein CU318_08870 [Acinetobacter pseudolwoffii]